jgi:hypothetical protein
MTRKEAYQNIIIPNLKEGEELVGYFQAMYRLPFWKLVLFGAFAAFSNKVYYVAVTSKGVHFHKLTFLGKLHSSLYYSWEEIVKIKIKKGVFQKPYYFWFADGKKLRIQAMVKGSPTRVALLNTETKTFLEMKTHEKTSRQ